MNRRAHIGTILMVFGALLLVGVSWYSFYGFKEDIKSLDANIRSLSVEVRDTRNIILRYMRTFILESIEKSKDSNNFEETFKIKFKELTASEMNKDYFQKPIEKSFEDVRDKVFAKIVDGKFNVLADERESYVLSIKDLSFSVNTRTNEQSVSSIDYNFNIYSKFNKSEIEYLDIT